MSAIRMQNDLVQALTGMEGKPYPIYKAIKGGYQFQDYQLWFDHIQGDPFAALSKVRVKIPIVAAEFPDDTYHTDTRSIGVCDFLARVFCQSIKRHNTKREGSGKSGIIEMNRPGQEILKRSSIVIKDECIEDHLIVDTRVARQRVLAGPEVRASEPRRRSCVGLPIVVVTREGDRGGRAAIEQRNVIVMRVRNLARRPQL